MSDHIHMLLELSVLDKFSLLIKNLKASSSQWMHKTFSNSLEFAWQEGYGSFSVSYSALEEVRRYIQNQELHHAKMSFKEEYLRLLKLHNLKYDERFVLG